ncbi:MAG: sigma-70 family RNA polymerase sigma factor, partial [Kiritimatiellae bacterium]|nr:sigma-70 family RNA polymerase sigma factor [Kiritimatiellia bacterium]
DSVDANILREAVEKLPAHLRETVVLHYFMDQPLAKVAKLLALPIGTVKSRLHYARVILGQRLGATLKKPMVFAPLLLGAGLIAGLAAGLGLGSMRGAGEASFRTSPGLAPAQAVDDCKDGRSGGPGSAYLEANGSQALVLDYCVNARTRLVVDFQLIATNTSCRKILGAFSSGDNSYRASLWYNGPRNIEFNIAGNWQSTLVRGDLARHVAMIDIPNRWLAYDGWRQRFSDEVPEWGEGVSYPLALFGETTSATPTNIQMRAAARVYSLDIYEDDELVRKYRPAIKGGRVGFYDSRTGRFAVSQAPLAYGGDIRIMPDDPHLQSDRTQTIALDYAINAATRLEVDYALMDWTRGGSTLFGTTNPDPDEAFRCMYWVSGGGNMQFNVNGSWIPSFNGAGVGRHVAVLDFPKMRVEYMTGETPAFVREIPAESAFTAARKPLPIMFFGENWGDPLCLNNHNNRTVSMKLYGVRAYEHGRLVRDYRPALRDGVPCLHDEVTGAFCTDPRDQAPFLAYCGQIPLDKIFGLMMVFK